MQPTWPSSRHLWKRLGEATQENVDDADTLDLLGDLMSSTSLTQLWWGSFPACKKGKISHSHPVLDIILQGSPVSMVSLFRVFLVFLHVYLFMSTLELVNLVPKVNQSNKNLYFYMEC